MVSNSIRKKYLRTTRNKHHKENTTRKSINYINEENKGTFQMRVWDDEGSILTSEERRTTT